MANTSYVLTVDISDVTAFVDYVVDATEDWSDEKREELRLDLTAALKAGIDVRSEKPMIVAEINNALFEVLDRYNISPAS